MRELSEQTVFTAILYDLAAREGAAAMPQEVTSPALDRRCRAAIHRTLGRGRMRFFPAAILAAVLLTGVCSASPVVQAALGNLLLTRTPIGTEFRIGQQKKAGEEHGSIAEDYDITFGYLPDLPLLSEDANDTWHYYIFGTETYYLHVELMNMKISNVALDSENAVITQVTVQGRQGELYDHGDYAIVAVPWDDTAMLNVIYQGDDCAAETALRIAEELEVVKIG